MAPLMHLSGDEIVEASLLEAMDDEPRTSPTLEEEATLLGEELELQEAQGAMVSSKIFQELLSLRNQLSGLMLWVPLVLHS